MATFSIVPGAVGVGWPSDGSQGWWICELEKWFSLKIFKLNSKCILGAWSLKNFRRKLNWLKLSMKVQLKLYNNGIYKRKLECKFKMSNLSEKIKIRVQNIGTSRQSSIRLQVLNFEAYKGSSNTSSKCGSSWSSWSAIKVQILNLCLKFLSWSFHKLRR